MTPRRLTRVLLGLAMVFGLIGGGTAYASPQRESVAHPATAGGHGHPGLSVRPARDAAGHVASAKRLLDAAGSLEKSAGRPEVSVAPAASGQGTAAIRAWGRPGPRSPPADAG